MYHLATEGMPDSDILRINLQIALGEFLVDEGFDLLGSSSWEIRVGCKVSIIAHTHDGTFGVALVGRNGGGVRVPWEEPFESIARILWEHLGVGGSDGMLVARTGG